MDYLLAFHWWYLLPVLFFIFLLTGKSKGGTVVGQFIADMQILDDRFHGCNAKARYSIFKEGKPDRIKLVIKRLTIPVGDELRFYINNTLLAKIDVKRNNEAEFNHWSDEDVLFPTLTAGDELVIKYQGVNVIKGIFKSA